MQCHVSTRSTCRVCGTSDLFRYLHLSDMPFTDDFLKPAQFGSEFLWSVSVYFCRSCGLSQTLHDVDVGDYYRQYQYTVGASGFAQRFMQALAGKVWHCYDFHGGDVVIEVGSGDGAQLACFKDLGARVLGFEPSSPLVQASLDRGVPVVQCLFDASADEKMPADLSPAQVVLLTYTFDHLPDPVAFLHAVERLIDKRRGVLVIEIHDIRKIMDRREFCLFSHEHSIYCCPATLQQMLARGGFELLSTELLPDSQRRGNSLLVAATPKGSDLAASALPPLALGELGKADNYVQFGRAVERSIDRFGQLTRQCRDKGVRLAGYGAGGRGVMTLATTVKEGDFAYLCDRNPSFHGYFTPKTHVPVFGPEQLLKDPVQEAVVFSFGYFQEIFDELAEFRARGGKLVSMLDWL